MMSLDEALWILERSHTRDDEITGYVVETLPRYDYHCSQSQYLEAWGVMRAHNRRDRNVKPAKVSLKHLYLRDY